MLVYKEPYRLFFPFGICCLLWGALIWLPLLWSADTYPVLAHRYLMLNGFTGLFIAGFLMTAVPNFFQTWSARPYEVWGFLSITGMGIVAAYSEQPLIVFLISSLQALFILIFLTKRIFKRKSNPPYSFVFIFVGLILWFLSGILILFLDYDFVNQLHYEGAIASIILGVGSRLIPGILGHVEIVNAQKELYERPVSLLKSIPTHFFFLLFGYIASFFLSNLIGSSLRALIVVLIGLSYWRLWQFPMDRTALTWSLWTASWMILISFVFKAYWQEGEIHIGHSFFISGIVLLALLIATRVLQSHGPKDTNLENKKVLFLISFFLILAATTRVSAFMLPELYFSHLAYSSIILSLAVLIWSWNYLRFVITVKN